MWKRLFPRSSVEQFAPPGLAGRFRNTSTFLNHTRFLHWSASAQSPVIRNSILEDISQDELFRYTSGRWLFNEKHQLEQRFVKFDINSLCRQAVSLFDTATECMSIVKVEGNFNKALVLTMDDGNEVIAKIPCSNAGMPSLTTASEVATLKFLRSCTSIRVPEVLAWSSDPANPVGAEYIFMEKIPGIALAYKWDTMNTRDKYKVIAQVVEIEKELVSMKFPAYGSLFLRESRPHHHYRLPADLDPSGLFCVGPFCDRPIWNSDNKSRSGSSAIPRASFPEFALSIPQRELDTIANSSKEVQDCLSRAFEDQSLDQYSSLLEKAKAVLPTISRHPLVQGSAEPVLWHSDLHLGNIFVSKHDPTIITGIIDWQSAQILPLLTQAQFPEFLRPPKNYVAGIFAPKLPDNFEELDSDEKDQARSDHNLALLSKYYEMSCLRDNTPVHTALKLDRRLWEPFTYCSLSSHGSLSPLRNTLIRIPQDWDLLELPGSSPFLFSEEELKTHNNQLEFHQDIISMWQLVQTSLLTDSSGWTSPESWEAKKELNRELFDTLVECAMKEEKMAPHEAQQWTLRKWPFPPDGY